MLKTLQDAFKSREIRDRLVYTFFMLIVVRLGCCIPIPFANADQISELTKQFSEGGFSFFTAMTGGSMENMSIFSLNITPYITSSIIMQLLTIAIPKLEEMQKDGEEGRKKIASITRYVTVALALIESAALIVSFAQGGLFNTDTVTWSDMHMIRKVGVISTGIISMTAGSAALMWIGEQITEKGVGNGISIVLTINIISRMPASVIALFQTYVTGSETSFLGRITAAIVIAGLIIAIVALVVILQGGTRRIGIQMSQKVQGRRQVGAQSSSIPLRVNTAGVIPIIFAASIFQFPIVISRFVTGDAPSWTYYLNQEYWFNTSDMKYTIGFVVYVLLIVFFAYFYTEITFNPREVAKNLNDRGGFIPGIRSGKPTVEYLTNILSYVVLIGAIGLIIVAAIPIIASGLTGASISFGGTSIIIIVGVILETIVTIKSMMAERSYKDIKGIF